MPDDYLNTKRASERAPNLSETALDCLKVCQKLPKMSQSSFDYLFFFFLNNVVSDLKENIGGSTDLVKK